MRLLGMRSLGVGLRLGAGLHLVLKRCYQLGIALALPLCLGVGARML